MSFGVHGWALVAVMTCTLFASPALADPAASPSPSSSPTPGYSLSISGSNVFVTQGASGPGLQPAEAPYFENGLPLSPATPYDWFSSAPTTPGTATQFQYLFTPSWRNSHTTVSATFAAGFYDGDLNTLMYWSEPWIGPQDPHKGHSDISYTPYFPTMPGVRDAPAAQLVLPYSASYRANDGSYAITGGYFDLAQTSRFVFAAPPVTNVNPSTGIQTAETLGPGMPSVDAWSASAASLPLYGVDAHMTRGTLSAEISDALLPSLPGTTARAVVASVVDDRHEDGRFTAAAADIRVGGSPIGTTTYFGADQTTYPGPQGRLYTSTLADQHQVIAGVSALVHPLKTTDALLELGSAWYTAGLAAHPGTQRPGSYIHAAVTKHFDKNEDAAIEYYRFDPHYATVIMPYGVPEDVWSVAWSWPGNWLKSTYQAVDNSIVGINREGFRLRGDLSRGRLEVHAATDAWRQITPATLTQAAQEGWVEGFFLPQHDSNPTIGWQRQANLYAAWHLDRDDLVLDSVWDRSYRPAGTDPLDYVSMNYPEFVASWQHHWTKKSLAVAGYGRYSANGQWSVTPVAMIYDAAFAGAQWDFSDGQQLLVQLRHYTTHGAPSIPRSASPATQGTTVIVDHRISLP